MDCVPLACGCPFCSPRRFPLDGLTLSKTWSVWLLIVLLLLRGSLAASLRVKKITDSTHKVSHDNKVKDSLSAVPSQKMIINASEATDCALENCYCYGTGKCKLCSRLDIGRKLPECLLTGYKQRAYCPTVKGERHVSCHYLPNPAETRTFWLFEGSAVSIGAIAYGIVYLRQRRIEKMVARRILQQINA